MKKIYNAGNMFNESHINQRKLEGKNLRLAFPNMEILNPIEFVTNSGGFVPSPQEIWVADYECVRDSEYIINELDSFDMGTMTELALAIEMAKTTQPNKFIVCVISDFRYYQKSLTTQISEFSINHFTYGGVFDPQLNKENRIFIARGHDEAIKMISLREKFLETNNDKYLKEIISLDKKWIYQDGLMYIKYN